MKNRLIPIILLVFVTLFASCNNNNMTVDEVTGVLPTLVENSLPLNEIYFGHGFKPLKDGSLDELIGYYYGDTAEYGFGSINDIKEATEKVFTAEYSDILYKSAFEGHADGNVVVPAKYIEGTYGIMQSMNATVYNLSRRVYNYDTLSIKDTDDNRATVSVETEADGVKTVIEMIIVRIENPDGSRHYRLDSPTY